MHWMTDFVHICLGVISYNGTDLLLSVVGLGWLMDLIVKL